MIKNNRGKKLTRTIAKAGLVPSGALEQYKKWGLIENIPSASPTMTESELIEQVEECLEDECVENEIPLHKEIDFDIMRAFLQTQKKGNLIVGDRRFEIQFGRSQFQDYILPHVEPEAVEFLLEESTCLVHGGGGEVPVLVFFTEVREVIVGDRPLFLVCKGREE